MVETRSSKRRRLMSISLHLHVSSWPDVPARFESLNDDTLTTVLEFVGNKSYRSFGGLNKHCREVYLNTKGMAKETFLFGYGSLADIIDRANVRIRRAFGCCDWEYIYQVGKGLVLYNRLDVLAWLLEEQYKDALNIICRVAAEEGRITILDEVWNNIDVCENKRYVFRCGDHCAARCGKLNVLKWFENTKGLGIDKETCAYQAASGGQLHIIQWLQEEKGLQLKRELYHRAIYGKHLHIMKWLQEKEVDWDDDTFLGAAYQGNLDILQWLHDEDCPWPEDSWYRVNEYKLKPGVVQWLRVNGYGGRLYRL